MVGRSKTLCFTVNNILNNNPMNIAQAKCIPIADYLARQGHEPKRERMGGRELWYHSPIRDGDEHPSFKVDTLKNVWFDHGKAEGGTIIELVKELCACDIRDALRHLEATHLYSPALMSPAPGAPPREAQARRAARGTAPAKLAGAGEKEKSKALELVASGPLEHPALLQYLTKRGIDHDIARRYLSQIDFKAPETRGNYFALGYPAGDGFEARNALFKGFVGTGKDVTFHDKPGTTLLRVFEGFMDFLSYLTAGKTLETSGAVLVLNSTNLWKRALPYVSDPRFEEVRLYLDNNEAGSTATAKLAEHAAGKATDMRDHFAQHEDLNAWLLAQNP